MIALRQAVAIAFVLVVEAEQARLDRAALDRAMLDLLPAIETHIVSRASSRFLETITWH